MFSSTGTIGTTVAHQPLVHEAPGVPERRVSRLHPDVGDVEVVLAGEGLDEVAAQRRVHREGAVDAVAVVAPVGEAKGRRHALDGRREALDVSPQ